MVHSVAEIDVPAEVKVKFNEAVPPEAVPEARLRVCAGDRRAACPKMNTPAMNIISRFDTNSSTPTGEVLPSGVKRNRIW